MNESKKNYKIKMKKLHKFNKGNRTEQTRKWRLKNPEKYSAHKIIWGKKNTKKTKCDNCGKIGTPNNKIERHHPDYKKPLLIIYLCNKCHRKAHNN